MRFLFIIIMMLMCCPFSTKAQTDSIDVKQPMYSVRHGFVPKETLKTAQADEFYQKHLYQAGVSLQKGATYQYCSLASSLIGGIFIAIGASAENNGARTGLFIGGGVMSLTSIVCLLPAIHFHDKAGRELRLSAGEVTFKF